jgi:ABC-type glutathione transport system ATPase component
MAVIMVTHDLRLVERIADHVIYLEQGRIVEEGRGPAVLKQPKSEAFRRFLAEPGMGEG